ncbi:MAG: hypothetical protein A2V98_05425 [Planctomycetes bacterium RBG_16_64_12]|nr:MAG: hypothetical protein A2V98_05425 [Planctomycetes bacterium RBG_16_64_12]
MEQQTVTPLVGLIVVGLAGALNGTYALPLKKTPRWAWENTWLVYSVVGMVVAGWAMALCTVPHLPMVYASAGREVIALVFVFGMLWGVANFLFGKGIDLVGIGLAFPITIGLSLALGSLLTMAAKDPAALVSGGGIATALGVVVTIAGVTVCAVAGVQRERIGWHALSDGEGCDDSDELRPSPRSGRGTRVPAQASRRRLVLGLGVVIVSGLFDPMLNFAFHFGGAIEDAATAQGASPLASSDALWVWPLLGSFVANAAYCSFLLTRNRTWQRYAQPGTLSHWGLAALMGVIWMASIALYGRGASLMGTYGKSVGWAVFYCAIILFSGLWGILSGEWRAAKSRPLRTMLAGLAVLLAALIVLGYGNSLLQ